MDKLRPAIAFLKKYYFWVFAVVVLLVGLGGWYTSISSLDEERQARTQEIESSLNAARQIASTANHPNTQYAEEMQTWLTQYRDDIDQAWQKKWEAQKGVLTWPAELNVGGSVFADIVNGILLGRPIEALTEEDKPMSTNKRELYRDYIKEELPKLAEIIHARWAPAGNGMDGGGQFGIEAFGGGSGYEGGGMAGMNTRTPNALEKPPLVMWNPTNQANIQSKSFDWSAGSASQGIGGMDGSGGPGGGAGSGRNVPTTKEVLYAQENLWVLRNIMNVIAKTNGDISSPHQATIKAIDTIEFGREVMPIRSTVVIPRSPLAAGGSDEYGMESGMMEDPYGGSGMGMEGMDGMGMDGMGMGPDGMPLEGGEMDPGDYRYVDKDYKKLMVEDLKAATTEPTSENYYLSVAKRLPVRMRFLMDQREIDKLLVECGNADLMIEVRQVRINPQTSGAGGGMDGGSGMGGYGGSGMSGMGGLGGMEMGGEFGGGIGGMSGTGQSGDNLDQAEKIFDAPVEIYGIIYIYNPVNRDLLWPEGSRPSEDDSTADDTATETAGVTATTR
ncbi:hypothetical protein C5Y96_01525 [Blastopirellula marina]|uniref:Uncharacterized protein n=1 Tax=Blastopirellula marina TaxID=124 RepID=A0A2S8G765_9BACT|nr:MULTISPECIES: hypothetical protein [Pirellulaceae]PQO40279.1 hypothetical protein C5Y96_01525 [Blastopirellula marina]RCS55827.1 hypothetical protein DTL36_01525 [Bremerella cremea]